MTRPASAAVALLAAVLLVPGRAAAAPVVTLTGPGTPPTVGTNFDVILSVTGGDSFANGIAGLTFDTSRVSYVTTTAGPVFSSFFGSPLVSGNQMFAAASFQFTDSRTATGTVATITFQALSAGSAAFSTVAKTSDSDPDYGRTGFATAGGIYLATTVSGPLNVSIVPEPTTLALLAGGAGLLLRRRRSTPRSETP